MYVKYTAVHAVVGFHYIIAVLEYNSSFRERVQGTGTKFWSHGLKNLNTKIELNLRVY